MKATCATDEEFNKWIKSVTLIEIIISSFFDIADFTQPIHYFMDDLFMSLRPEESIVNIQYFKRNRLELNDNIFGLFNTKVSDFFY